MSKISSDPKLLQGLQQEIKFPLTSPQLAPIVAVGGVGGSGTRVVAALLRAIGISIGGDINEPLDNLWFTLLFKQAGILDIDDEEFDKRLRLFVAANSGNLPLSSRDLEYANKLCEKPRLQHGREWLLERAESLAAGALNPKIYMPWGWKEPNTHVCIGRLAQRLPGLKYIHIARNGLDMAFSNNLAQLEFWGVPPTRDPDTKKPEDALAYWCNAHRKIFDFAETLGERFLFLRFEELCNDPEKQITGLLEFLAIPTNTVNLTDLCKLVIPPDSIGRFRQQDIARFDPADVEYVSRLGFAVGRETAGQVPKVQN